MDEQQTPEEPPDAPRVIDRLHAAGLSDERIQEHLAAGRILVDGQEVADLDQPAPPPARPVIGPS